MAVKSRRAAAPKSTRSKRASKPATIRDLAAIKYEASDPPVDMFKGIPDWDAEGVAMREQLAIVQVALNSDDVALADTVKKTDANLWIEMCDRLRARLEKQEALIKLSRSAELRILAAVARVSERAAGRGSRGARRSAAA